MASQTLSFDLQMPVGASRLSLTTAAQHIAISGPSGGGKSSLMHALAGVLVQARGKIQFGSEVWLDAGLSVPAHARGVGWVPQDTLLVPHLGVQGNLTLGGAIDSSIIALCRLEAVLGRSVRSLSGGEQKRVALARALLRRPRLLLLDETFSSFDSALSEAVRTDLRAYCGARSISTVTVTHHPAQLGSFAEEHYRLEGALFRV